jgi:hypothetical protein
MGMITIQLAGSFTKRDGFPIASNSFSAMKHGHADAVAKAIEYLAKEVLPAATALDHKLAAQGASPDEGFDRNARERDRVET